MARTSAAIPSCRRCMALSDFRRQPVSPSLLHDQFPRDDAAGLGDARRPSGFAAGALSGNQAEIGHELARIIEAPEGRRLLRLRPSPRQRRRRGGPVGLPIGVRSNVSRPDPHFLSLKIDDTLNGFPRDELYAAPMHPAQHDQRLTGIDANDNGSGKFLGEVRISPYNQGRADPPACRRSRHTRFASSPIPI